MNHDDPPHSDGEKPPEKPRHWSLDPEYYEWPPPPRPEGWVNPIRAEPSPAWYAAVRKSREAAGLSPSPPPDPVEHALAMRASGDLHGAIRHLYAAFGENLSNTAVIATLATMLSENREFDRAERVFQRAFSAGVQDAALELNYATFLAASGRGHEAVERFRRDGGEVARRLQAAEPVADPEMAALIERWAIADCNLARLRYQEGNVAAARDLAEKWLTSRKFWRAAHDVVEGCLDDETVLEEFERLRQVGRASPGMIATLMAYHAQSEGEVQLLAADGDLAFGWDWRADADEFERGR